MAAANPSPYRIGHGYDLHRLEPTAPEGEGRPFILAGVKIDHNRGPVGHSDGDAAYHAVTDAVFSALGHADIGEQYPDNDPAWEGADSSIFLDAAAKTMHDAGYLINNLDVTVICEKPKISPHKKTMIANLAHRLDCDESQVNIKGKTHEQVDAIGEGRAVEVHVVVLLVRQDAC